MNTLNEQDWERLEQANVLANVRQAFDASDRQMLEEEYEVGDMLSPPSHTDAQTLALMLQQQLDAINKEIRYLTCHCYHYIYLITDNDWIWDKVQTGAILSKLQILVNQFNR